MRKLAAWVLYSTVAIIAGCAASANPSQSSDAAAASVRCEARTGSRLANCGPGTGGVVSVHREELERSGGVPSPARGGSGAQ